jgi:hypothetical protein
MGPTVAPELLAGPRMSQRAPWRALLSAMLVIAVLLASLHHLSCGIADGEIRQTSAVTVALEKSASPAGGDVWTAVHCHCVCHVSNQLSAGAVCHPVIFASATYGVLADGGLNSSAAAAPFEPPRG